MALDIQTDGVLRNETADSIVSVLVVQFVAVDVNNNPFTVCLDDGMSIVDQYDHGVAFTTPEKYPRLVEHRRSPLGRALIAHW